MGRASKDKRDIYYRRAKEIGYRARSAFKLLQIDRQFNILDGATCVVDLCAAPGGWTEVLSDTIKAQAETTDEDGAASSRAAVSPAAAASVAPASACAPSAVAASSSPRIVAVDLQAMPPLPGVLFIQGDLTRASTAQLILQSLASEDGAQRRADLVVCDGAPDVIGLHDLDEAVQHSLTLCALNVSLHILRPGSGAFVAKIFRGRHLSHMLRVFAKYFTRVALAKPKASRNSSIEGFVVCTGFKGLAALGESARDMESDPVSMEEVASDEQAEAAGLKDATEFVSCWDEELLDSDKSYPLSFAFKGKPDTGTKEPMRMDDATAPSSAPAVSYHQLAPSALPIDPPYMRSLRMKKEQQSKLRIHS